MKILLDTNIIIDNFARRDNGQSLQILELCEGSTLDGVISTVTIMDAMCILRKSLGSTEVRSVMQMLLQIVDVVPALKSDVSTALAGEFGDFEDAVQASCALRIKAQYIVTRNVKDFEKSAVPAILPDDMLALLNPL